MTDGVKQVVRVVTLPVREVVGGGTVLDTFRPAWRLSTDLANWCQRELALADCRRTPDAERLPKFDAKMHGGRSLYQRVNDACPFRPAFEGAAGSMGAVIKAVEDAWRSHPRFGRFAVIWKGESRPAVFRFPYPWPVRSQELRVYRNNEGRPMASLTLPGGRVEVRLGDGPDFRRQLASFDLLLADPSRLKQAKVTGRSTDGRLVGADLRLVGAFDARQRRAEGPAAVVRTDPNALLVVEVEGRQPWVLNCDQARRLQAAHKTYLQRTAEDLKREKRLSRDQRRGLNESRARRSEKHGKRIDTLLHQVSAQVAGLCERAGASVVVYDDAVKSFVADGFPWAKLRERLAYKVEGIGAEWVHGGESQTE